MNLGQIIEKLRRFTRDREWEKYHNPKNLAMAISIEANELLEHFVWKTTEESKNHAEKQKEAVGDEMADVAIYLLQLADLLGLDLLEIVDKKIAKNAKKYPVAKSHGSNRKYTEHQEEAV